MPSERSRTNPSARSLWSTQTQESAFTFTELLVVVLVVALCVVSLLPAWARTQPDNRVFQCLNNHRQLTRAWRMYADDYNGRLAPNAHGAMPLYPVWAAGWLDWDARSENTNSLYLTDPRYSALARYCGKDARLFKCPADQYLSPTQRRLGWNRVRSVSENLYVGESNVEFGPTDLAYYDHVRKWTGLVNPRPAETWLSLDEHPDSINDGGFLPPTATTLVDVPANYHDGGAGVAYADGHAEIHRWAGSVLRLPITTFNYNNMTPVPVNDPDLFWLRRGTPHRFGAN